MRLYPRAQRQRAGFTLIEVLLTSVLAATLLAALWALLSMYLKLFDAGQAKVEQSQLIRTLFAQVENDLASVVQSPPPVPIVPVLVPATPGGASGTSPASGSTSSAGGSAPSPPSASAPPSGGAGRSPSGIGPPIPQMAAKFARGGAPAASAPPSISPPSGTAPHSATATSSPSGSRSPSPANAGQVVTSTKSLRPGGVFGTETSLRIDVVQSAIVPLDVQFDERRAPGELGPSRAAELMTIVYSFEEIHEPGQPLGQPTLLLVRREMAWEDSHPAGRGGGRGTDAVGSTDIADRRGVASGMVDELSAVDPLTPGAESETTATIPEVAQFGIRYFDGTLWSTEWNSIERKALPVAIEIALELKPVSEQGHQPAVEPATTELATRPPVVPVHRLLVHLPGGQPANPSELNSQRGLQTPLRGGEPPWKGNAYGSPR